MILSKANTYFLLQAFCAVCLLLCQSIWLDSQPVNAAVTGFYTKEDQKYGPEDFVTVAYKVRDSVYRSYFPGDALDHRITTLRIRCLCCIPAVARIDDFVGNWLFYLIIYVIWFLFTSILFFVPNDIVPRGSLFRVSHGFPWVRKCKE